MNKNKTLPYYFVDDLNVFIVIPRGAISFQDLLDHVEELMGEEQFSLGMNGLYDFTKVTHLTGDLSKFEVLASNMSDQDLIEKSSKTSMIIGSKQKSLHTMMEGYLLMTSGSNVDYKIFDENHIRCALKHIDLPESFKVNET